MKFISKIFHFSKLYLKLIMIISASWALEYLIHKSFFANDSDCIKMILNSWFHFISKMLTALENVCPVSDTETKLRESTQVGHY